MEVSSDRAGFQPTGRQPGEILLDADPFHRAIPQWGQDDFLSQGLVWGEVCKKYLDPMQKKNGKDVGYNKKGMILSKSEGELLGCCRVAAWPAGLVLMRNSELWTECGWISFLLFVVTASTTTWKEVFTGEISWGIFLFILFEED